MSDESPAAGFNGAATLDREFSYDALYRLLEATGREAANYTQSADPSFDYVPNLSHQDSREYTRSYTYDMLGNMLKLHHDGGTGNIFNRYFNDYDTSQTAAYQTSNLATKVKYGATTITNSFDANGNMVSEGSSRHFEWDYADQMRVYRTQTGTSIPSEYAHYLYDAAGNRVKKIVRKQGGDSVVSVYIDGGFEHLYKRSSGGTKSEEHNELQVMDGRSRIASVRVGTAFGLDTSPVMRYNIDDHLGNASFTLDTTGSLTHREEYFPFGETSFGSYSKKRYRFCGKERDEESGLYYYGARYYMPWQCRFVSVDPLAGEYPFYTPYQYAGNQPIIAIDLDWLEPVISNRMTNKIKEWFAKPGAQWLFDDPKSGKLFEYTVTEGRAAGSNAPVTNITSRVVEGTTITAHKDKSLIDKWAAWDKSLEGSHSYDMWYGEEGFQAFHQVLDFAGILPYIGIAADLFNAALYAAEGNYEEMANSLFYAFPGVGDVSHGLVLFAKTKDGVELVSKASKKNSSSGGKHQQRENTGDESIVNREGQVPSIQEQALEIKKKLNDGKNSVSVKASDKKIHFDLDGATHKGVETPHVQYSYPNTNPNTGQTFFNKDRKTVDPMNQQDIRTVRKFLKKRSK